MACEINLAGPLEGSYESDRIAHMCLMDPQGDPSDLLGSTVGLQAAGVKVTQHPFIT